MNKKFFFIIIFFILCASCTKEDESLNISKPSAEDRAYLIYNEAIENMEKGDWYYASKKFTEAELIMPNLDHASKSLLMASFCLYQINFYPEAEASLKRFVSKYPADKNIEYAKYLMIISQYEQILDEKKDIKPLLLSRDKINEFIKKYPESEYTLDLKFKNDLISNQLAYKELYIAKYYIKTQKWVPAINRLKNIVNEYDQTIFIEEALHRLVEIYYKVGLLDEAKSTASLLGYNYNTSEWYQQSYKILNKNYELPKIKKKKKVNKDKEKSLIKRTIKKLLLK
jgi:outer membrane protein assembly factor BamD